MPQHSIDFLNQSTPTNGYPNTYTPIPANGESCPHTGLKHAYLYKLLGADGAARDFVRVVNLRDPKARHGKTLFHVGDMLHFLDQVASEQGSGAKRSSLPSSALSNHCSFDDKAFQQTSAASSLRQAGLGNHSQEPASGS